MTSFEFNFKKSNKQSLGKVFKKKISKKVTDKVNQREVNFPSEPKLLQTIIENTSNSINKSTLNRTRNLEDSHGLVKRKGKKEKRNLQNAEKTESQNKPNQHSLFSEKYKSMYINTAVKGKSLIEKVFSAGNKFGKLDIHKHLVSNLDKHKFNVLTNVQEKALPAVLKGSNVLVRSQTGSGKTLVYAVPILNKLISAVPKLQRTDGVQAIIVVPTRELVIQVVELLRKLNSFQWIIVGHLCGGENRKTEKDRLRKGVHILVGTPGRLLDHILHTSALNLKNVHSVVLDEADRLLDMGFKKDIVRLVEELDSANSSYDPLALLRGQNSNEPNNDGSKIESESNSPTRQCILLSATLSKGVAELADFIMKEHFYIDALDEIGNINPDHMIIPDTVKQEFMVTFVKHRLVLLSAFIVSKSKQNECKMFIFMATSQMVDFHYDLLQKYLLKMPRNRGKVKFGDVLLLDNVEVDDIEEEEDVLDIDLFKLHGSMEQRIRKEVFAGFKKTKKGVLLCTDVAARGLDVPEADCIIQYNGPQSDEDYLHRVGRTGRAGNTGSALIFLTHEEQEFVSRLQNHKVFLKEHKPDDFVKSLTAFMEEPEDEKAILALQRRYENALLQDKDLHKKACFAYSSWARFYSSFPNKLKPIFDFKKANLGHYVTSFGLKDTPTAVSKIVKGQISRGAPKKLNKKLANHEDNEELPRPTHKRPIKSLSLTTSEYSSGLDPVKKKKKKNLFN